MPLFHRHKWIEVGRDAYRTDGTQGEFKGRGPQAMEVMRDLVYGYTIVSLRCEGCGDVRTHKLTGVFRDESADPAPSGASERGDRG